MAYHDLIRSYFQPLVVYVTNVIVATTNRFAMDGGPTSDSLPYVLGCVTTNAYYAVIANDDNDMTDDEAIHLKETWLEYMNESMDAALEQRNADKAKPHAEAADATTKLFERLRKERGRA